MSDRTAQMPENEVPRPGGSIGPNQLAKLVTSSHRITPGQGPEIEPPRRNAEPPRRTDEPNRPNRPGLRSALAGRNDRRDDRQAEQ